VVASSVPLFRHFRYPCPVRLQLLHCVVRSLQVADASSIAKHGNNRNVWMNLTDRFPHPYTVMAALKWITSPESETSFAIDVDGVAVGAIGVTLQPSPKHHSAEIGYWLGESYWGRGIASEALRALTDYAFEEYNLVRIYAHVFESNPASMRVLEKCGYVREAWLKKSIKKDGRIIDQALYAMVREDGL
jgi:[ribosomal protein S5]-alanine N-acetyltransferase